MSPAYLPNSAAVIVGGGRPIDGGWTWKGTRILGDGKTWRGAVGGFTAGFSLALGLNAAGSMLSVTVPVFPIRAAISLPAGAIFGDVGGSFIKRRLGYERGAPAPILDQLGFAIGAFVLTWVLVPEWFRSTFTFPVLVTAIIITPILHLGMNVLAYLGGFKDVPW